LDSWVLIEVTNITIKKLIKKMNSYIRNKQFYSEPKYYSIDNAIHILGHAIIYARLL